MSEKTGISSAILMIYCGLLFIVILSFIILKLAGVIAWPWWLVLAPLWVNIVVGLAWVWYQQRKDTDFNTLRDYED